MLIPENQAIPLKYHQKYYYQLILAISLQIIFFFCIFSQLLLLILARKENFKEISIHNHLMLMHINLNIILW